MLALEIEQLPRDAVSKLREWLDYARCDALVRAANAEQMVFQAEYSNALLKNPLEAIGIAVDTEKERRLLASAARLAVFLDVLDEFRDFQHDFVSVRLANNP